jgi:hypothetical protein
MTQPVLNGLFQDNNLGDKLKTLIHEANNNKNKDMSNKNPNKRITHNLPDPKTYKGDNVDHLLISYVSKTKIGKTLKRNSPTIFNHNILGTFRSIENFILYINTVDRTDNLRRIYGTHLYEAYTKCTKNKVNNLEYIVADAVWQMVNGTSNLLVALRKRLITSTLPFDIYTKHITLTDDGVVKHEFYKRPSYTTQYLFTIEEIRKALKENREPDFSILKDKTFISIEESLKLK